MGFIKQFITRGAPPCTRYWVGKHVRKSYWRQLKEIRIVDMWRVALGWFEGCSICRHTAKFDDGNIADEYWVYRQNDFRSKRIPEFSNTWWSVLFLRQRHLFSRVFHCGSCKHIVKQHGSSNLTAQDVHLVSGYSRPAMIDTDPVCVSFDRKCLQCRIVIAKNGISLVGILPKVSILRCVWFFYLSSSL